MFGEGMKNRLIPPQAGRGGVALLAFSKNFDKMSLRNVANFPFKVGSRIFKQRALP